MASGKWGPQGREFKPHGEFALEERGERKRMFELVELRGTKGEGSNIYK